MKCWICHKEMENTIGGCYHCKDCGVGVNDLVFRLPIKNKENNKIAEITIAEGDLEKENEVLRRALVLACDELDTWHRSCDNRPDYFMQQAKESMNEQV